VCLFVREHISQTIRAIFTNFLCVVPIAVARSSSGGMTKSRGEEKIFGVFVPIDSALYSRAFGTHTKTAEPIEMPFGLMTWVGFKYLVLDGGPDPKGKNQFGGKRSGPL